MKIDGLGPLLLTITLSSTGSNRSIKGNASTEIRLTLDPPSTVDSATIIFAGVAILNHLGSSPPPPPQKKIDILNGDLFRFTSSFVRCCVQPKTSGNYH